VLTRGQSNRCVLEWVCHKSKENISWIEKKAFKVRCMIMKYQKLGCCKIRIICVPANAAVNVSLLSVLLTALNVEYGYCVRCLQW
jgi:hypothetical protein